MLNSFTALEPRQMLASLQGTNLADLIRIGNTETGYYVEVNGTRSEGVLIVGGTAVTFDCLDGDDRLTVDPDFRYRVIAYGGGGNDTLTGGPKGDTLAGQSGNDTLLGLGGGDALYGGDGDDSLDGGASTDLLYGDDETNLNFINNPSSGTAGNDTLVGGDDRDTLYDNNGNDLVYGGDGVDFIENNLGNDTLDAGAGDDVVALERDARPAIDGIPESPPERDIVDGNGGNDQIVLRTPEQFFLRLDRIANDGYLGQQSNYRNIENISARVGTGSVLDARRSPVGVFFTQATNFDPDSTLGPILIYGSAFNDRINVVDASPGTAPLAINAGAGDDEIFGGNGNDRIDAGAGNDTVYALGGDDLVRGEEGDDLINGDLGRDRLYGDAGRDTLIGASGNDRLFGGADPDILGGGNGNDYGIGPVEDTHDFIETFVTVSA